MSVRRSVSGPAFVLTGGRVLAFGASFFIPAWVAEHYPDTVRAIAGEGHEVGCHGDEHERVSDLPVEREEQILLRSVDVLTGLAGRRPVGYRAPAWQLSHTSIWRSRLRRRGLTIGSGREACGALRYAT